MPILVELLYCGFQSILGAMRVLGVDLCDADLHICVDYILEHVESESDECTQVGTKTT